MRFKHLPALGLLLLFSNVLKAQFLTDMIDTTTSLGKGMFSLYQKYDAVRFSGYLQPQFQYVGSKSQFADDKGVKSYAGGDFPAHVDNRFTLRRGRFRLDYSRYDEHQMPKVQFAFQFDGTERGVFIRDFFGRVFENHWNVFSVTAGMFGRPFSYEVNLASADRETPERGRMSQILMKTERDLGAMISFEPRKASHPLHFLRIDAGLFNGQGLTATSDFDSHKDLISRIAIKPQTIFRNWRLSGAISCLYGGMEQFTQYIYRMNSNVFKVDSSVSNLGKIAPRHYYGADIQLKIPNGKNKGVTEIRGEFIKGLQTATAASTETPGTIPMIGTKTAPLYIRNFTGAYFYLLQNLGSPFHQLVLKYDWYDPNSKVKGKQVTADFTEGDIRYDTFGAGYIYYLDEHMKLMLYYDIVKNEKTALAGYTSDVKDNVFTCRLQYRF